MPLYRYQCHKCGFEDDSLRSVDEREIPMYHLDGCGGLMDYIFVPSRGVGLITYGPGHPREQFGGPRGYQRHLQATGGIEAGDASYEEFERAAGDRPEDNEKRIDAMAQKMAERCMSELKSEVYTTESQHRDVQQLPDLPHGGTDVLRDLGSGSA